jgi:hypothetical protein
MPLLIEETTIINAAGMHLVLSRLLQRRIVAALAPTGVRDVDIVANLPDGAPRMLKVISRQFDGNGVWRWLFRKENPKYDHHYYCFVDFRQDQQTVHVIPSGVVQEVLNRERQAHNERRASNGQSTRQVVWTLSPTMKGTPGNWMNEYLESWDLLKSECREQ